MMKKGYKEYRITNILLLVIFVALLFSCEKNNKTSGENNGLFSEQESEKMGSDFAYDGMTLPFDTEIPETLEHKIDPLVLIQLSGSETSLDKISHVMTVDGKIHPADSFLGGIIFAFAVEGNTGYSLETNDVFYIKPDMLASKYREYILRGLQSIFSQDRISDIQVIIKFDVTNLDNVDGKENIGDNIYIKLKPNAYGIIVVVNIDGGWKIKYDEKHKLIISPDGSIEREYIPLSTKELELTKTFIQNIIDHGNNSMDSVTVRNIPFDRTKQFAAEDAAYFKRQKIGTILFFLLGLVIIGIIISLIFSIKHYKRKRVNRRHASD